MCISIQWKNSRVEIVFNERESTEVIKNGPMHTCKLISYRPDAV